MKHYMQPDEEQDMTTPDTQEQEIARLLRAAGPREELPEKLRQSWENQFRAEIQPIIKRRKQRVRYALAACATVAVLAITALLFPVGTKQSPVGIQVVSTIGNSEVRMNTGQVESLSKGHSIRIGSVITTDAAAYAAIDYGGYDLRLNSGTTVRLLENSLQLESGELYVSSESKATRGRSLSVKTDLGTISDIGTQFTVAKDENGLRANVRRGVILFETEMGEYRAEATQESSSRITLDINAPVAVQAIKHGGREWDWVYDSGPTFELEGRSVYDFLQWSAHEAGLDVEYVTKSAEVYARTTILHGETGDLKPQQAIEAVLATTHLRSEHSSSRKLQVSLLARN